MPKRIQLRREKGWRLREISPDAIKVDRSGPWGNPYRIGQEGPSGLIIPDAESATGFFRAMLRDPEMRAAAGYPEDLSPLRGHDLACWCSDREKHCHADVLLEIANG